MLRKLTKRFPAYVMSITAPGVMRNAKRLAEFGFSDSASNQLNCMRDLTALLRRHRPHHIVELGAGFSTVIFADWCRKVGARLTSIEENGSWARHVAEIISATDDISILVRETHIDETKAHYVCEIPLNADFVYVDGPKNASPDGTKRPCADMLRAFEAGTCPRVIVIDGRDLTVDLLRSHPTSTSYEWYFAADYADARPGLQGRRGRHTVAVLHQ